ncbi:MAG TPA: GAF domain-containing protein, partial [Actinomycetes bacterium]|nr:GAF domain-containing protein [Actinomycetes bacterium]
GAAPQIPPLSAEDVERRRVRSGLAALLPRLTGHLAPVIEAGQMVVVTDTEGRVLWRRGNPRIKREADRLGFVGGSAWTEGNVGTNAIGTALVLGAPVHVRGPEHFADSHTRWGCAAAPLVDPWTGCTLGVVDVSGPSRSLHPTELAVVAMAARLATLELRDERAARLERLRAVAAPVLAQVRGKVVVVDPDGHVAAVSGMSPPAVISLPKHLRVGPVWLPTLGEATAEVLPGGWLLRLGRAPLQAGAATEIVLDLSGAVPELRVTGPSGRWQRALSLRHAEIVVALLRAEQGRSPAELAADLFADATRVVTVRAEMSRLRRVMGALLESRPYRLADGVTGRLLLPDAARVLPGSSAPAVTRLRAQRR